MARKKNPPTREQFTDEQWSAFDKFCRFLVRLKARQQGVKP